MDLESLKNRLSNLGVDFRHPKSSDNSGDQYTKHTNTNIGDKIDPDRNQKDVKIMLERINRVENALTSAENQATAASQAVQEELLQRRSENQAKSSKTPRPDSARPDSARNKKPKNLTPTPRQVNMSPVTCKGLSSAVRSENHMKRIPAYTPLAQVLAQFKEAEAAWANEKARLRREALTERKRANTVELEHRRLERLSDHRSLDLKALKTALKNRDAQLEAAGERVAELEMLLERTQEEAAAQVHSLAAERDGLRQLLMAALQRLETVDQVVQRADVSTTMMEEKMRSLEEERVKAVETAARARAEVQDLAESRRKLQWQSKLLEKMSEVQLKHNQRKSDAIRRLLNAEAPSDAGLRSGASDQFSDITE